jgi:signal transduction histidine kinase
LNIYEKKQRWKLLLFLCAVLIGVGSLTYTNRLVKDLSTQERKTVELWAEAVRILISSKADTDLSFPLSVIEKNITIPVILADSSGNIVSSKNFDESRASSPGFFEKEIKEILTTQDSIHIKFGDGDYNILYYKESILLQRLQYFPLVQLGVIVLFIFVSYFAFSSSRKAEQNKVWVGLSKETAHQLGTPTSSLNGWVEILKQESSRPRIIEELEKDVKRLEKITERFSKIGSKPVLNQANILDIINNSISYLKNRSSDKVKFSLSSSHEEIIVPINEALFEWVLENVCKNAIDAMNGKGKISITVSDNTQIIYIDISDSGKGVPKAQHKTIFKPGFTTKERGWGLGLSLSKRIMETYHEGKIFILNSEIEKGTTIRLVLKK